MAGKPNVRGHAYLVLVVTRDLSSGGPCNDCSSSFLRGTRCESGLVVPLSFDITLRFARFLDDW